MISNGFKMVNIGQFNFNFDHDVKIAQIYLILPLEGQLPSIQKKINKKWSNWT